MSSKEHFGPGTVTREGSLPLTVSADAREMRSSYLLSMRLALQAALEAGDVAKSKGWDVTATVVDMSGTPIVVLRGDGATIHTKDTSYRKAYTVATIGPIFHITTTRQFVEVLSKYNPLEAQAFASTPNLMPLAGGISVHLPLNRA